MAVKDSLGASVLANAIPIAASAISHKFRICVRKSEPCRSDVDLEQGAHAGQH